MGPDSDTLMGPETMHMGESVGKDSGLTTREEYQSEDWWWHGFGLVFI